MDALPHWQPGTPAVLVVAGSHAIPVSTATRAGDRRLLFALGRRRETLARLRDDPAATLCVLGQGVAFSAYGDASVLRERLESVPVVPVELRVDRIQDHLSDGRTDMLGAASWRWREQRDREADRQVGEELRRLAGASG